MTEDEKQKKAAYHQEYMKRPGKAEKARARNKEWRQNNRDSYRQHMALSDAKRRGHTPPAPFPTLSQLIAEQHNRCRICQREFGSGKGTQPNRDHDHVTGRVRAALCGRCNVGIGYLQDSPDLLLEAAAYLQEFH